jgi:hypothetical protein
LYYRDKKLSVSLCVFRAPLLCLRQTRFPYDAAS